jgi:hypothetical protein
MTVSGGLPPPRLHGWTQHTKKRRAGATAGKTDRYWYTPEKRIRFRSLKKVLMFMEELKTCDGDEILAASTVHNRVIRYPVGTIVYKGRARGWVHSYSYANKLYRIFWEKGGAVTMSRNDLRFHAH